MKDLKTYENNHYRYKNACWIFYFDKKSFPLRWHHYVEIVYSLQDGVLFEVNCQKIQVNTGDILFIWPGELHAILNCPEVKTMILQFDADLITERTDFKDCAYLFYRTRILRRDQHPELLEALGQKFMELYAFKDRDATFQEMRSCIVLYQFFIALWEGLQKPHSADADIDGRHETTSDWRMVEISRYITQHCTQELTLEAVAAQAGFSKCYFAKIFKAYTGQSFWDYLTKERLLIAETFLRDPEMSITDIFQESGFNSISTFNRVFLKFKKVNPTSFRKMYCFGDKKSEGGNEDMADNIRVG